MLLKPIAPTLGQSVGLNAGEVKLKEQVCFLHHRATSSLLDLCCSEGQMCSYLSHLLPAGHVTPKPSGAVLVFRASFLFLDHRDGRRLIGVYSPYPFTADKQPQHAPTLHTQEARRALGSKSQGYVLPERSSLKSIFWLNTKLFSIL